MQGSAVAATVVEYFCDALLKYRLHMQVFVQILYRVIVFKKIIAEKANVLKKRETADEEIDL